jgi:hypothetical protein
MLASGLPVWAVRCVSPRHCEWRASVLCMMATRQKGLGEGNWEADVEHVPCWASNTNKLTPQVRSKGQVPSEAWGLFLSQILARERRQTKGGSHGR